MTFIARLSILGHVNPYAVRDDRKKRYLRGHQCSDRRHPTFTFILNILEIINNMKNVNTKVTSNTLALPNNEIINRANMQSRDLAAQPYIKLNVG